MIILEHEVYEIFTDASFDDKIKIGTYSIVIMQEKKIVKAFAKKCKIQLENSIECEIFAIFQAINMIEGNLIRKDRIQKFGLRTDCIIAKDFFLCQNKKIKIFKQNIELYNVIKQTYMRVAKRMNRKDCSFQIKWIPRKANKIAHKYSHSVFQKILLKQSKNNVVLIQRKELLQFLQKFNSKQCKVLIYLYLITNENSIVLKTQKEIAKSLELSSTCINKIFAELIKYNMLEKIQKGKYHLLL